MTASDCVSGDHHAKMVYADYLDEYGDPKGPGYRAMGVCERDPLGRTAYWACFNTLREQDHLPRDWFENLPTEYRNDTFWPEASIWSSCGPWPVTREQCLDAAAEAFAKLPAARQDELLRGGVGACG